MVYNFVKSDDLDFVITPTNARLRNLPYEDFDSMKAHGWTRVIYDYVTEPYDRLKYDMVVDGSFEYSESDGCYHQKFKLVEVSAEEYQQRLEAQRAMEEAEPEPE